MPENALLPNMSTASSNQKACLLEQTAISNS
eukprot:CAMPEP_0118804596 /NCGR_PEP_ID=MMETSP1161-20130426/23443_1 /TAXON_ID=249345 /ORGANISM="Picochlorum oklahomensis, Strain CCMP2329" /LENGTH=30 /DNA_ID= /DNA_START= /DNA_END= /DNA_ORIENTATION=